MADSKVSLTPATDAEPTEVADELAQLARTVIRDPNLENQQAFFHAVSRLVFARLERRIPIKLQSCISLDDIAQETSLRLQGYLENDDPDDPRPITPALVFTVANRVLIDFIRRVVAGKRAPKQGFANASPTSSMNLLNDICYDHHETPSQVEIKSEFWQAAMQVLSEDQRELIELRYAEGLEQEEIAALFGATPESIRSRLYRIRMKIREELARRPEYESFL